MAAIISICTLNPLKLPKNQIHILSIFRRDLVNPSTPAFPNINITLAIRNFLAISKITEK